MLYMNLTLAPMTVGFHLFILSISTTQQLIQNRFVSLRLSKREACTAMITEQANSRVFAVNVFDRKEIIY